MPAKRSSRISLFFLVSPVPRSGAGAISMMVEARESVFHIIKPVAR